jgi:hypothetical protein
MLEHFFKQLRDSNNNGNSNNNNNDDNNTNVSSNSKTATAEHTQILTADDGNSSADICD